MNTPLLPKSLQTLVEQFSRLPGVGEKTALRYALAILREQKIKMADLMRALDNVEAHVGTCPTCFFWTDDKGCSICESSSREESKLCVVRDSPDILAIERFRPQTWKYHVLQGLLSPLQGVRPHHLRIEELAKRVEGSKVQEIILAIDATLEGDATCLFLRDYLKERFPHLRLMRTASGLPAGSSVEYLDASTLERALQNRLPFDP